MLLQIDWTKLMVGDADLSFLLEIGLRTTVMYFIILVGLKLLGKRGVKQLSVFELVVIISLGSAAGDPMFYKEVGPRVPLAVFAIIVAAYRITTYLMAKSEKFDRLVEGTATYLIKGGEFSITSFKKENLAKDEFFSELRQQSISHLGQVKEAIIETSGNLSIYFYEDEEVKYGLPILPDLFNNGSNQINKPGKYACTFCGNIQNIGLTKSSECERCKNQEWVLAIDCCRVK